MGFDRVFKTPDEFESGPDFQEHVRKDQVGREAFRRREGLLKNAMFSAEVRSGSALSRSLMPSRMIG
jgi:hypothetical protein